MKRQKLRIGLFGFGVVGRGLYEVMQSSTGIDAKIVKICVRSKRERSLPEECFCYDKNEILNNDEINTVVELIDDAKEAYHIVTTALKSGKNVVSANKKMIAENLAELIEIQKKHNVSLLYEASACGSIPIVRNLEEYYDNDLLLSVTGILNGSSNYILSKIFDYGTSYSEALKDAQDLGFAESDPSFDVEGFDSLYKLIILTIHSFGVIVDPSKVLTYGISNISDFDIQYAREKGFKIKLVGQIDRMKDQKISLFVLPRFVGRDKYIYSVEDEFNGVVIKGTAYDKQFIFGKGAGSHPTASAVLSDITALSHSYRYEYKKLNDANNFTYDNDGEIEIYLRYTDEAVLKHFNFKKITQEFKGEVYKYKIGTVKLSHLIEINETLRKLDVFVAATGNMLNY